MTIPSNVKQKELAIRYVNQINEQFNPDYSKDPEKFNIALEFARKYVQSQLDQKHDIVKYTRLLSVISDL